MAVSFVASSAVATGTNPTVAVPAGYAEKDLLLLITTGTATPTTPAGWTQRSAQGANGFITILFKFAAGTEASVALTLAGTTSKAVMLAYRGASAIDTVSGFTNNASTTSLAPGLTGNAFANELEISVYAGNNAVGVWGAAPSPTTSRVSSDPTATVNGLLIVDETQAAAGNSTARTGTISTLHNLSAVAIAIIPSGRYWVGGTGTWTTTTTNWSFSSGGASGAPAPTAQDLVTFDQAATYTVTLTGALTCFGMTVSAGTVTFSSTGTITNSAGMSLIAGTVWSATGTVTFNSTSTGRTITTNGVTINSPITFSGVGGAWSLGSALSTGVTLTTTLNNGTLTLNGFDLTTGSFSSSVATARSIAFGTNNIVLSQTTALATVLNMATATLFTYTGTGGFTATAAVAKTFVFGTTGGSVTNAPNLTLTGSGTAVQTFTTASWFNNLNFGTTAFNPGTTALSINGNLTLSSGGTFTTLSVTMVGTGTITTASKTIAAFTVNNGAGTVTLSGALGATTYTQTAGSVDFGSNNLSCSGAVAYTAGTLTNIATITCTTWTVTGAFTLSQGTITPSVSFVLTSGSFTYSGGTLSPVPTFTHTAGTVTLSQNYSLTSTGTYTLVAGTLTMTDRNLIAAAFITSGTGTRQIDFGTSGYGEITVTGNGVTVWDGGGAGITYTGNPRIVANYTGATGTRTVNLGTAWTEATAFDVTMQPASYPFIYGFQIINGSTDTISMSGVAANVSLTGFLFTFTPGVMTVYKDYTIGATGGTVSSSASTTTFASTNASARTITISRTVDFPITFSGVGGTFNLGATLTTGSTRTTTLTAGTLVLNGNSMSTGVFSSSGTVARSINFGSNFIALSSLTAATTVLSMADATNFTVSGTGGFNSIMAVAKTFVFGTTSGSVTNAPNLFINAGAGIPTITTNSWFNTLDFTGSTSTPATTTVFVSTLTLATGGTYTALTPIFTKTQTWTPQFSKQLGGFGFNLAGGTLTLGSSQSLIATATTTLTAGTLDLNGNDLTTGIFSSSNTNTRSIVFGSNNINLTHTTAAQTVLAMADATNFTLTTSTGGFVSNLSVTRTFQFGSTAGGSATNAPNLAITSGAAIPTITTNSWFNALNFTGTTSTPAAATVFVSTLTLATGGTYTGLTPIFTKTQTWTTQFSKQLGGIGFNLAGGTLTLGDSPSLVATSTTTLTAGTLDLGGFNLTTGIFSSSGTGTRAIAFGSNNIVLAHTTAAQTVLNMAIATGFTWTGTGGFTTDASVTRTCVFGTTGGTRTNAPNLTLTGAGVAIITLTTGSWFNNLSFGSTAFALAATTLNIDGNLTLSTGGTFTSLTLSMVGTGTILSNGKPILALTIDNVSGTTTLGDALTLGATAATTLTSGNLSLNGFTLTTGTFSSSNTNARSIAFGSANIVLATTTAAAVNLAMTTATNFTYTTSGTFGSGTGCFQATMSTTRTFQFGNTAGGSAANAPILYLVSGASIATITSGSWFNEVNFGTTAFTIAATNLNLTNVANGSSTSVLTALTSTMVATGTIYSSNSIGPVVVNTAGITTSFQNLATNRCTTLTVTQGTVFLDTNCIVICSSTCTLNGGTLNNDGQVQCTTLTVAGSTYSVSALCSWIISTSIVITSGSLTVNYSPAGGFSSVPTFTHTAGTVTFNTSYSLTATGTYTFTAGTLTLADSVILSAGIFSSNNTNTRSIAFGTTTAGNINLTHTTAATVVLSMATVTGFSYTGPGGFTVADMGNTRTFTYGTTGGTTSNAINLTFTTGASVGTLTTAGWYKNLNFGSTSFNPGTTTLNIVSSLTLSSAGAYLTLTPTPQANVTYTFNNASFGPLTINTTFTVTLGSSASCTTFAMTAGTLDFASSYTLTCSSTATYTGGTLSNIGTIACTTFVINGPSFNFTSGTINPTTGFTLTSGSFTYGGTATLGVFAGTFTHTAGTVTINKSYASSFLATYLFTAGTLNIASGITLYFGIFSSSNTNGRAIAFGTTSAGYINLTGGTGVTVLSMATLTGFTPSGPGGFQSDAAGFNTATYSCGNTAGGSTATAPSLSFTTGSSFVQTLTTGSWFKNLDFGTTGFNPGTTALNIAGSLTLSGAGTYSTLTPTMLGTGDITSNGNSTLAALVINSTSGTTSLRSALSLTATGTTTLTSGTLALNSYDLSTGIFSSSGAVARSVSFGSTTSATTGSIYYNGTNQYFSAPSNAAYAFSTGDFSVEAWIYLTTTSASWAGICQSDPYGTRNTDNFEFYLADNPVGRLVFSDGFQANQITIPFSPAANTWYHVAVTRQSGVMRMFVNGVSGTLTQSGGDPGTVSWNQDGIVSGYNSSNGGFFPGYISNLRVVKGVAVYTGNFTLPASPLAATQSSGTNISAITGTQTSLLLNAAYGTGFLTDSSTYNAAITNAGAVTSAKISPYRSNINLTHTTAATTVLNMATASSFTYTGTGGFVAAAMSNTRTFNFGATAGGSVTNAPSLTFTTGASVATLTTAGWFDNLDFGTTSFNPGTTTLNIAGDLTLSSTGTYTTLTPTMVGTGTIVSNTNTTLAALVINSTSGTTSLGDTFSLSATGTTTLTSGTLAMNRFNLTTGIFSSSGAVTRSIAFGGTTAASSASFDGSTQYASYAINSNIKVAANQPFTVEFWIYTPTQVQSAPAVFGTSNDGGQYGDTAFFVGHSGLGITNQYGFYCAGMTNGIGGSGTTTNLLSSTGNYITNTWTHIAIVRSGTDAITMYINGVVNATAIFSGYINFPTDTLWVGTSGNNFPGSHYTGYISNFRWVTGVAVYTGNFAVPSSPLTATQSAGSNISAITGTQTSILLNTVTGANILADSSTNNYTATNVGSVAGIFYNPFTGYINLAHTTAATTVLSMATATGFTVTGTGGFTATASITRTYVFGTVGGSATISPNLTLTGTGTAIATLSTGSWFNALDFGTTAFTIAATALNLNSLTLSTGGTFTNLTPTMVGTGTVTTNGKTVAAFTVNTTGTATLSGALTATGALTLTQGTLACSTYAVTSATFASTGTATRSMTGSGTYTVSGAGATAFSNASATGITITGLIISMTNAAAKTFAGGGGSYSTLNQGGAGALTISGNNSFSDISATTRPSTITFTAGSTQTFADFTLSGLSGSLVTINSSLAGTRASLSKSSGTVSVGYLSIQDSAATGGASWYAGTTSTNVSNNIGWAFTAPPTPGGAYLGNFFAFF